MIYESGTFQQKYVVSENEFMAFDIVASSVKYTMLKNR